jgi:hypothetical protein
VKSRVPNPEPLLVLDPSTGAHAPG